jgi:hypothetical protein
MLEPANNSAVPKSVRIRAQATPGDNLFEACLLVDRELVQKQGTGRDSVFTFIWDASAQDPGSRHSLAVEVIDNRMRRAYSDSVSVTITQTTGSSIHSGTLRHDETWTAAGSPHIVTGHFRVEAILTIEPGSVVKFRSGAGLTVGDGALIAEGSSSLITFTGTTESPGSWGSIEIGSSSQSGLSVMDNCLVEYGGSDARASIVAHAPVRIDNCVFWLNENAGIAADPMAVSGIGSGNQFSGNGTNDVVIFGGKILSDTRWFNPGVPYLVEGFVSVYPRRQTATLTIGPATQLHFTQEAMIEVAEFGCLIADGSDGMIIFTSEHRDDEWNGIYIWESEPTSIQAVFRNCLIENAEYDDGAILIEGSLVDIQNTTIRNCPGYGINCYLGLFSSFGDNTIAGCGDKAMSIFSEAVRTIGEGNSFTGNDLDGECHDGIVVPGWDGVTTSATWRDIGVPYMLIEGLEIWGENEPVPILSIGYGARVESEGGDISIYEGMLALSSGSVLALRDCDIEVNRGTLMIYPGARLEFVSSGIHVSGGIMLADGTGGRITLTSGDFPEPQNGDWDGIVFEYPPNAARSVLRNCLVEYGGRTGGNVICNACEPLIENNEIDHSSTFGIRLDNSLLNPDSLLAWNRFQDNDSGAVGVRPPPIIPPPERKVKSVSPRVPRHRELSAGPRLRRCEDKSPHDLRPAALGRKPMRLTRRSPGNIISP